MEVAELFEMLLQVIHILDQTVAGPDLHQFMLECHRLVEILARIGMRVPADLHAPDADKGQGQVVLPQCVRFAGKQRSQQIDAFVEGLLRSIELLGLELDLAELIETDGEQPAQLLVVGIGFDELPRLLYSDRGGGQAQVRTRWRRNRCVGDAVGRHHRVCVGIRPTVGSAGTAGQRGLAPASCHRGHARIAIGSGKRHDFEQDLLDQFLNRASCGCGAFAFEVGFLQPFLQLDGLALDNIALDDGVDAESRHQKEGSGSGCDRRDQLGAPRALALVEEADDRRIVAAVALRPGGVRLGLAAPGGEVCEFAAAQDLAGSETVDQPAPLLRRAALGAEPFGELLPLPDQALMADIDIGVGRERRIARVEFRHQEVDARSPERVDHGAHAGLVAAAGLDQLVEAGRTAHRVGDGRAGGQRAEHPFGHLRALLAEIVEDLVRMRVERAAEPADGVVVVDGQVDLLTGIALVRPLPHAVERVLQQRQLVGAPHQPVELVIGILPSPKARNWRGR